MLDMSKKMIRWALTSNDPTQSNTKSVFIVTTNCWIIYSFAKALKESLLQINNSSYHELCSLRSDKPHGLG